MYDITRIWRKIFPYPALAIAIVLVTYISAAFYLHTGKIPIVSNTASSMPQYVVGAHTVSVKGTTVRVTVVDTEATREQGLSGRASLAADEGMLFIFPQDGRYAFWMKDMRFPIDIFWISSTGAIVDIRENLSPDTYPQDFAPQAPSRFVLEVPAGFAKAHNLKMGDTVSL